MDYPVTLDKTLHNFPVDQLGPQGQAAWQLLQDKGYEVKIGLTPELAASIMEMAVEPSIREYCPKDSSERFTNQAAIENWLQKGRAMFLLVKKDVLPETRLVGYGWVGAGRSPHVPEGEATFALRIGEAGQGRGLATSFSRLVISGAAILFDTTCVWLETWESNAGAVHIYHKLGFGDITQQASERPTATGGTVQDTRLYMTLADTLLNP